MHRTPREKSRLPALQDWLTLQVLTYIKVSTSSSKMPAGFTYSYSPELPLLGKRASTSPVRYWQLRQQCTSSVPLSWGSGEKQTAPGFIQSQGYVCSAALLWLYSPARIAFSQKEIRIPPLSTAADPEDYAMQHAGEHHTPTLHTWNWVLCSQE